MKKFILGLILIFSGVAGAQKAVLIEDGEKSERVTTKTDFYGAFDLRSKRRVGFGLAVAGQYGTLGAFTELNFGVENSAVLGFGIGGGYNAAVLQWKHVFSAQKLTPYIAAGYARWFSGGQSGSVANSSPQFLNQKLLSENEKQTGRFGKDLLIPSAGIQYYILNGQYVGSSLYAEVMMLMSPAQFDSAPIGSLGYVQYF